MPQFKIEWDGFHLNVHSVYENKEQVAISMQLLNIICKLAQSYNTPKTFLLTVSIIGGMFRYSCVKYLSLIHI